MADACCPLEHEHLCFAKEIEIAIGSEPSLLGEDVVSLLKAHVANAEAVSARQAHAESHGTQRRKLREPWQEAWPASLPEEMRVSGKLEPFLLGEMITGL